MSKNLQKEILFCANKVQNQMEKLLPKSDLKIMNAMRYSALSQGKKIRPFLLLTVAKIFDVKSNQILRAAAALEFVHVYSLIHDDLPAMDDDDYRRGKLSCHKKFDEATAILAGDALLTYAFEILANTKTNKNHKILCELVAILARSAGFAGMVCGQMIDLENKKLSLEKIGQLHELKTANLFMAACEMAAAIGGASKNQRDALREYAKNFGLIFQICDDIDDYKGDKKDHSNIVNILGEEESRKYVDLLAKKAKNNLAIFDRKKTEILIDLIDYCIDALKK